VILSVPASVNRNAPLASLAGSIEPQGPNGAKTIPFKNVLDGLESIETPNDDNGAEDAKAASQGATFKKNAQDPTSGKVLNSAAPHSAPPVQFPNQNLAQLAATLARPTPERALPEQNSSPQNSTSPQNATSSEDSASSRDSSIADVVATEAESAEQDHTEPTVAKNTQRPVMESSTAPASALPVSHGITLAPVARLAVNVSIPSVPANPAPAKSSANAVRIVTTPDASANTIPVKSGPATPAVASSKAQTRAVVTPSVAPTPSQAKPTEPTPLAASSKVPSDPIKPEVMPMKSGAATRVPDEQTAAPRQVSQPRPQAVSAAPMRMDGRTASQGSQSDAAPAKIVKPTTPGAAAEAVETAPVPAAVTTAAAPTTIEQPSAPVTALTTPAAPTTIEQPAAPSTKPKDATSRRALSPESTSSASTPSNVAPSTSGPPAVAQVAPLTGPAAKSVESAKPEPETPDSSATPRSEAAKVSTAIGAAGKNPLAPKAENFAFAVRMVAPDDTTVEQTKPVVALAEPQINEPKPAVNQQNSAPSPAPQIQQPQSQASSNSKRDTQPPAAASDKTDTRAPRTAAALPQPADARETATRWSEVNIMQPSEVSSARVSSELDETAHPSPALAAQEAHLTAPELPKTSSTSSEILLHLTGNDQSSAAIRVAERAGSVNVTVHASDPVLRESLRSNLGELSTQLSQQGWKAETLKPVVMAAQPESQQDSHAGGQRSSQQQSFGGDRQPQRDRRSPGGQWQQELEQQISGGDAHPGGNR